MSERRLHMATKRTRHVTITRPEHNPHAGRIGWCHSCETVQVGDEARWRWMQWGGYPDWCCVTCDDEPWGIGVWLDSTGYWPGNGTITPAAATWLDSPAGTAWANTPECDDCGERHQQQD
jgi:hypothetical protein